MRWATRAGIHVDRTACAWLIRRFVDPEAEFIFVDDPAEIPEDATPFDMRGVELGHRGGECSFEAVLRRYEFDDAALWDILIRGLSMVRSDTDMLELTGPLFDGLYEFRSRATQLGRDPS
jgi:hypothetical protein